MNKPVAPFTLTSPAFEDNGTIPVRYTCEGENISPELSWTGIPQGTQSFALIVDDPDAPGKTFTHWVLYAIPSSMTHLPAGTLTDKVRSGRNSSHQEGWISPCPPSGTHHYHFTLYALDIMPDLQVGASKEQLLAAMQGHILDQAILTGLYAKKITK